MRCHFIRVCCTTLSAVALTLVLLLSGCDAWTTAQGTAVRAATLDDSQTVDIPIDHDIYGSELPHALPGEILGGTGIPGGVAQLEGCRVCPPSSPQRQRRERRFARPWMPLWLAIRATNGYLKAEWSTSYRKTHP